MSTSLANIRVGHGCARFDGDSFKAGREAAREAIAGIGDYPISAVLVFSSVCHELSALLSGIREVTGNAPLIGVTTAGEICNGVHARTAVITVLASPHLKVHIGVGRHVSAGWRCAVDEAINASPIEHFFAAEESSVWSEMAARGSSAFGIVFSPGNTRNTATFSYEIVQQLRLRSAGRIPFFGGCAADDWTMSGNYVLCGEHVYADGLLVAIFETGLQFGIAMAHGFQHGQRSVTVTRARDHEVLELDGRPAAEVYAELVGSSRESLDDKHLTLATGRPMGVRDAYGQPLINVATYFTHHDGISFAGPVSEGTRMTLMEAVPDQMVAAGKKALLTAMLRAGTARPAVALVCSCALRSRMLKQRTPEEISGMMQAAPQVPVLGFYGYGEEGVTEDGRSDHNHGIMSVLVLGDELTCSARIALGNEHLQTTLQECTTERKHVSTILRDSNQHFMGLFEGAYDAIFVYDRESGTILDLNAAAEKLTKRHKYELVGLPCKTVLIAPFADAGQGSSPNCSCRVGEPFEAVIVTADQQQIAVEVHASVVEFSSGKRALQAIVRDITQRKRADAELRRLNRALATLSKCNEALVHATNEAELLNQVCEIAVEVGGYRLAWVGYAEQDDNKTVRLMAKAGFDEGYIENAQITWDDTERGCGPSGMAIKTGEVCVLRNMLQTLEFLPWRNDAVRRGYSAVISLPLREGLQAFGVFNIYASEPDAFDDQEVNLLKELASNLSYGIAALKSESERKRTEQALRKSEARYRENEAKYRAIVESFDGLLYVCSADHRIEFMNAQLIERTGRDATGELCYAALHNLNSVCPWCVNERVCEGETVHWEIRSPKDGHWFDVVNTPIFHDDGTVSKQAMLQDITDRKQAEQALRQSEERFREVVESSPVGIFIQTDGIHRYFNPAALAILGAESASQLVGRGYLEVMHPDSRASVTERARIVREEKKAVPFMEERLLRLDGTVCDAEITAVPFVFEGRDGALVFVRDITARRRQEAERRDLEQQLRQSQKMEAVGRLAGGIAHDFNNLLMVVQSYAEILQDSLPAHSSLRNNTRAIMKASGRAASLTAQMLAFSRKQFISPVVLDLNAVIDDTAKMLCRLLGEDIDFRIVLAESLWAIKADPDQMVQVLMNLCINSRDAMPQGGTLTIATSNVTVGKGYAPPYISPGKYVKFSIADTGIGISKDVQEDIFEPFFTTKEVGKGTGLGLAMVYGIVKQSGGYVLVNSDIGEGACFTIYLPMVEDSISPGMTVNAEPLRQGTETLLIVEDEDALREALCDYLRSMGYMVLSASSGQQALSEASGYDGHIDLLITDVVMPKMSGRELSQMLTSLRPDLNTIYMSGYNDDAVLRHGIHGLGATFLQKPISLGTLARKVRDTLEARSVM